MDEYGLIVLALVGCAFVSLLIAQAREAPGKWVWFGIGFLLGPIGILFAWFAATPPKPAR